MVQAIEVLPEQKPAIRINAGSEVEFVDWNSCVWTADAHFSGGTTIKSASPVVHASPTLYDQELYRTARSARAFGYTLAAPPGLYTVHLKFAELWLPKAGERPMDIAINGRLVRKSWDPAAAAGRTEWPPTSASTTSRPTRKVTSSSAFAQPASMMPSCRRLKSNSWHAN